jgi:hypothetical protein
MMDSVDKIVALGTDWEVALRIYRDGSGGSTYIVFIAGHALNLGYETEEEAVLQAVARAYHYRTACNTGAGARVGDFAYYAYAMLLGLKEYDKEIQ